MSPHPNSFVEALTLNVMILGGEAFDEVIKVEPPDRISVHIRRGREQSLCSLALSLSLSLSLSLPAM